MLVKARPMEYQAFKYEGSRKQFEDGVKYYEAYCAGRGITPWYSFEFDEASKSISIESFRGSSICSPGDYVVLYNTCEVRVVMAGRLFLEFEPCLLEGLVGDESSDFLSKVQ